MTVASVSDVVSGFNEGFVRVKPNLIALSEKQSIKLFCCKPSSCVVMSSMPTSFLAFCLCSNWKKTLFAEAVRVRDKKRKCFERNSIILG